VGCAQATVRRAADRHGIVRDRSPHRLEFPDLHNLEALRRLADRGLDPRGVAEAIGCSRQTAGEALRHHGIYTRPRRPSPPAGRLQADWRLLHNVAAVARLHGVTPKTARRWLLEAGLLGDGRLR
jgi:transposase-like protein